MRPLTAKLQDLAFEGTMKTYHAANRSVIGFMDLYNRIDSAFHRAETRLDAPNVHPVAHRVLRPAVRAIDILTLRTLRAAEDMLDFTQHRLIRPLALAVSPHHNAAR